MPIPVAFEGGSICKIIEMSRGEKQVRVKEFVAAVTCDPRMRRGLAYMQESGLGFRIENVDRFLQFVNIDVVSKESNLIQKHGLTLAEAEQAVSNYASAWFMRYLEAIAVWRKERRSDVARVALLKPPTTLEITGPSRC